MRTWALGVINLNNFRAFLIGIYSNSKCLQVDLVHNDYISHFSSHQIESNSVTHWAQNVNDGDVMLR